jgi:hypothetical protein
MRKQKVIYLFAGGVITLLLLSQIMWQVAYFDNFFNHCAPPQAAESETAFSKGPTRFAPKKKRYRLAIAIVSGFDWQEQAPYYVSKYWRRQAHRTTWMQHPAVQNKSVLVYFLIGNQQSRGNQGDPKDATHNISELELEMSEKGDIVLLNSLDFHNDGKMNAWYEWASLNIQADYHMKLDDESYLVLDRLLATMEGWPRHKFLGGYGLPFDREYGPTKQTLKNVLWIRGWGYIMSDDLVQGLGDCSRTGKVVRNHGEHEDVYNAVALRVCGLDNNITWIPNMPFQDLLQFLNNGCPKKMFDHSILFHG